jgi:uncharacterized membrane protein required for colicin V production
MVFWLSIFLGGLFIWLGVRMGFYEIWTVLFDTVVSIYTALFLTPVILEVIPVAGVSSYGLALTLLVTAFSSFLILSGISYVFLTSQFKVSFPKTFDILLAGFLGFLTGFLVSSFISLAITVTPFARNRIVSTMGFNRLSQQPNISYVCWWCDAVNSIVSMPDNRTTSIQIVNHLLDSAQSKTPDANNDEDPASDGLVEPRRSETNTNQ